MPQTISSFKTIFDWRRKKWWFYFLSVFLCVLSLEVHSLFPWPFIPRSKPLIQKFDYNPLVNAVDPLHSFKLNPEVLSNSTKIGNIFEYADYDGDSFVDIISYKPCSVHAVISGDSIATSTESGHISIYLWNATTKNFNEKVKYVIPSSVLAEVVAIVASDYNYDGKNDLLVIYSVQKNLESPLYMYEILLQEPNNLMLRSAWKSYSDSTLHADSNGKFYVISNTTDSAISTVVSTEPRVQTTEVKSTASFLHKVFHFLGWRNYDDKLASDERTPEPTPIKHKQFERKQIDTLPFGSVLNAQPLLADVDLDGRIDLISQVFLQNGTIERTVFLNNRVNTNSSNTFEFQRMNWTELTNFIENTSLPYTAIAHPHSSAFVDINGDQRSDIILMVESNNPKNKKGYTLEIWLNSWQENGTNLIPSLEGRSKYVRYLFPILEFPSTTGQLAFADMNADGLVDILVPLCERPNRWETCHGKSEILYFEQRRIKEKGRLLTDQILFFPNENISPQSFTFYKRPVVYSTPDYFKASALYPTTLRVGDFDNDGYPDILTVFLSKNKSIEIARLLKNTQVGNFTTVVDITLVDKLTSENAALYGATFFDLFEDGALDLALLGSFPSNHTTFMRLFQPTFEFDGLFLKAISLNGVCSVACTKRERLPLNRYGGNAHGAAFRICSTDINGRRRYSRATQLMYSAFSPLQMPFVFFGLGRTNNYVEEFVLGMPIYAQRYSNMWPSIIPNTQIVALPYPLFIPNRWTLELSLSPSILFFPILWITLASLVFIGAIIFFLHQREKQEDSEESKGFRSHFIVH